MAKWVMEFWSENNKLSPVERWLDQLEQEEAKSVSKELEFLELLGNKLKLPHSKALGKGLFELRERRFGFRIYYCFKGEYIIILLTAGNKKSQEKDIIIARKRLSDL
jgi:putative addiction module killer protein